MKLSFHLIIFSLLILFGSSCYKSDLGASPPTFPSREDTLGFGWQKISMPDSLTFIDVFFVNDMIGYLAGSQWLAKSIDGGLTWNKYNLADSLQEIFRNIYFTDSLHGWVMSSTILLRTEDGGISWQGIKTSFINGTGNYVHFISPLEGFMSTSNGLFKSGDGGKTWTKTPGISDPITALYFLNSNLGWVASSNSQIRKTVDGGSSFGPAVNVPDAYIIYGIQFTDNSHGWASTVNGVINRTINGGSSWEKLSPTGGPSDVHFFDNNNGFLFSGTNIYSTTNGGTTLAKQAVIRKSELLHIHFTNLNHGWAVGVNGGLYRFSK